MSATTILQVSETTGVDHKDLLKTSAPLVELDTSPDDWVYPYPTDFKIHEHPIDEVRELKVMESSMPVNFANKTGRRDWSRSCRYYRRRALAR